MLRSGTLLCFLNSNPQRFGVAGYLDKPVLPAFLDIPYFLVAEIRQGLAALALSQAS
jgi:hypothetical protein